MDVVVKWNSAALRADWIIQNGGFLTDAGLRTAVLTSLFTDRRAPPDWVPPAGNSSYRGGFFGDTYRRRPIGSWLWLLYRSSIGDEKAFLAQVRNYCQIALKWLIEDGISASNEITTGWITPGVVGIDGVITRPTGLTVPFSYPWLWQQQQTQSTQAGDPRPPLTDDAGNVLYDDAGNVAYGSFS